MSQYIVRDIMTRKVVTISPNDTLLDVYKLMQKYNINRVVVVDEEYKPIGILTVKDIVSFLLEDIATRALDDIRVNEAMTKELVCVKYSYPVTEAAKLMLKKNISSLPIISDNGKLMGIVTKTDICRFYMQFQGLNPVKKYMSSPVITIRPYDSIFKAAILMTNKNISRLVVVEKGKVKGIITLTDLALAAPLLKGVKSLPRRVTKTLFTKGFAITVADLMTSDPITVHEDDDLALAARLMINHGISGLPVLDISEKLSGIITKTDITRAVAELALPR